MRLVKDRNQSLRCLRSSHGVKLVIIFIEMFVDLILKLLVFMDYSLLINLVSKITSSVKFSSFASVAYMGISNIIIEACNDLVRSHNLPPTAITRIYWAWTSTHFGVWFSFLSSATRKLPHARTFTVAQCVSDSYVSGIHIGGGNPSSKLEIYEAGRVSPPT